MEPNEGDYDVYRTGYWPLVMWPPPHPLHSSNCFPPNVGYSLPFFQTAANGTSAAAAANPPPPPNSHLAFSYDSFTMSSYSNGVFLGNGTLPAHSLSKKNETSFRNVVVSGSSDLDAESVNALRSDLRKKKSGVVMLKIELETKVKVKMGGLKMKKVGIRVTCDGIKGSVPKGKSPTVAGTSGSKCKMKKFTEPRKRHRTVTTVVEGKQVPLYGGLPLISNPKVVKLSIPLNLTFVVRSRAYILGRLVQSKFYSRMRCHVILHGNKLGTPHNLTNACFYY